MKIVVRYEVGGGYECGTYETTLCLIYDSPEAFLVHFEEALNVARLARQIDFNFSHWRWDTADHDELPEVYSLEEWHAKYCINP